MNRPERVLTDPDDLAYAAREFRVVSSTDPARPGPAYTDAQGRSYVPHDYESHETDAERFAQRARSEMQRLGADYDERWIADAWEAYWDGAYAVCLRDVSPENIVRKQWVMDQIDALVDELDRLERPFCAFDRTYFGGSVSRDRYITGVGRRHETLCSRAR